MAYSSFEAAKLTFLCHIDTCFCHSFVYFPYLCGRKGELGRLRTAVRPLLLGGTPALAWRYARSCSAVRLLALGDMLPFPDQFHLYFRVTKNDYSF